MGGRFDGRVGFVTGGTSGIGLAVARRFVREGGRVVVGGRDEQRGRAALDRIAAGNSAQFVEAQLDREDGVRAFFDGARAAIGGEPDILVNAAGELYFGAVTDPHPDQFLQMVRTNLIAPYLLTAFVAPGMVERGWGRIVNVTTMATHAGIPMIGAYSATKAALASYTQTCAAELAASGVTVNAVAPGPVPTPMGNTFKEGQDQLAASLPAKRKGTEEEIAAAILFLASDEASYIHGVTLFVDGGWAAT